MRNDQQSYFNSDYPWAIANIDRAIVGEDAGLEIKTTSEMNLKKFKCGEYPANYYCQMVHYMAVTGKQRWYLAVLIGNHDFRIFTLERDEDEIKALMDAEKEFWQYVETKQLPPIDGLKSTTDTIAAIYTGTADADADLSSVSSALDTYISLGQRIKELETLRDEAANRIKLTMASAERGEAANYYVTWRQQTRKSFDVKAFAKENPDIDLSKYYKESNFRTFKVAERKDDM